jgi:predicted ATP-binding protein involved in virulence
VVTQVKELQLRSFRGIDRLDLKLHPKVSVFLGVNGVGKSTILDALSILLSKVILLTPLKSPDFFTSVQTRHSIQQSTLIHYFSSPTSYPHARNVDDYDIKRNQTQLSLSIDLLSKGRDFNWSFNKESDIPISSTQFEWADLGEFVFELQKDISADSKANIPLIVYYSTNRIVSDVPLEIPGKPNLSQFDSYDGIIGKTNTGFPDFFRWFRMTEDLENESRRDNTNHRTPQLEAIRKALPVFLDSFSDLRVRRSPTLRMTVTKGDRELLVNQLSDGEKCLLAMVGDIARRLSIANPGLDDPLQGEGVILIDELELHLHPKWQRGIIPKLTETFPNCQFIVATHSPQIVSDVQPESIFILKSTDYGVIVEHPDHSFGRDSNQILEDLMGVSDRPEAIKTQLQDLFELIENGELDQAKQIKNNLEHLMGLDEPEFAKADVLIRRREILGR